MLCVGLLFGLYDCLNVKVTVIKNFNAVVRGDVAGGSAEGLWTPNQMLNNFVKQAQKYVTELLTNLSYVNTV